jgi:cytochrome c peroxidase
VRARFTAGIVNAVFTTRIMSLSFKSLCRVFVALAVAGLAVAPGAAPAADTALVELGRALFFDVNLSATRQQSCATCHDPARGFVDPRDNGVGGALSLGSDGRALGDRNAPTAAYAALVPPLTRDKTGEYRGGLFHDGRARDLVEQAGQPMLNPLEMQMPDAAAVVARVRENPVYVAALTRHFGAALFEDDAAAFKAVSQAIASFERSPALVAFDSRYDRYLRGEVKLTAEEDQGRVLFFSSLTNCTSCHLLETTHLAARETFTNHRYFNIGLPANAAARAANGKAGSIDHGLAANPAVAGQGQDGKFRVPTLRNVAVSAPYMHNGVFKQLSTAIFFYNQHLVKNARNAINPETGQPWGPPEVPATVEHDQLALGQPLDDERIALIVAFLATLTDQRFEPLLKK